MSLPQQADANRVYNIKHWGSGYFSVNNLSQGAYPT